MIIVGASYIYRCNSCMSYFGYKVELMDHLPFDYADKDQYEVWQVSESEKIQFNQTGEIPLRFR